MLATLIIYRGFFHRLENRMNQFRFAVGERLKIYPQPGKARSREVLQAFAEGWRGGMAAAFYGVVGLENEFARARASGEWIYGDNSFTDLQRGRFFRFARNAFQVSTLQQPDHARAKAQGVTVRPWQHGRHIVIVEQSAHFLNLCGAGADWLKRTLVELGKMTDRPLRIRPWRRDKGKATMTLQADLQDAHALVTHMSAAAVEALLAGVPVFVTGPCAVTPMASGSLSDIERPSYPDGREDWCAGLAGSHWTLQELRKGMAWRRLCAAD